MIIDLPTQSRFGCKQPGFNRFVGSRGFRAHWPLLEEFLEEWYDRSAETCDMFVNISEVDKYCVTCTVCRHFDACGATDLKGPSMLALLKITYKHDSLP